MKKYIKMISSVEDKYKSILHLSANENILTPAAERMLHSSLHNRYYMGPGEDGIAMFGRNAAFKGMPEISGLLDDAQAKASKMLHAKYVSFSCLSGVHAMMCGILSLTKPGDVIMSVPSNQGGHFCTKGIIESTGRKHVYTEYDRTKLTFDVQKIVSLCKEFHVKAIYFDVSVYLNPHPIKELRRLLGDEVIIFYDASHTLGLIMGGLFQSPLEEGADFICANTHKTFPGPHRGIIAFKDEDLGRRTDHFITHNFVSTLQTQGLIALAATVVEFHKWGKKYAQTVVDNANALAGYLSQKGHDVRRSDGELFTKNHQVHLFVDLSRKEVMGLFLKNNISINTSGALGDRLFIRLGLQEVTMRGMVKKDMKSLAGIISDVLRGIDVRQRVRLLNGKFTHPKFGCRLI